MEMVVELKQVRCDDVFRTVEDDIEAGTETVTTVTGLKHEDEKGVLVTYLDLMSPHVRTKDAKRKASMQTPEDSNRM